MGELMSGWSKYLGFLKLIDSSTIPARQNRLCSPTSLHTICFLVMIRGHMINALYNSRSRSRVDTSVFTDPILTLMLNPDLILSLPRRF